MKNEVITCQYHYIISLTFFHYLPDMLLSNLINVEPDAAGLLRIDVKNEKVT